MNQLASSPRQPLQDLAPRFVRFIDDHVKSDPPLAPLRHASSPNDVLSLHRRDLERIVLQLVDLLPQWHTTTEFVQAMVCPGENPGCSHGCAAHGLRQCSVLGQGTGALFFTCEFYTRVLHAKERGGLPKACFALVPDGLQTLLLSFDLLALTSPTEGTRTRSLGAARAPSPWMVTRVGRNAEIVDEEPGLLVPGGQARRVIVLSLRCKP